MIVHTERNSSEERLIGALRGTFDASVMNFGSYNLLYAENLLGEDLDEQPDLIPSVQERVTRSRSLLVGYRREPVEMVLCPVILAEALPRAQGGNDKDPVPSVPALVNLTNLAGLATEDSTVEVALSTGRRVMLDVQATVTFPELPEIPLHQRLDVEDFYGFLDCFMDRVERMGG